MFTTTHKQFLDDNLNELIALEKQLPEKYKFLIPSLKELKRRIESQRKSQGLVDEISTTRAKELSDQLSYYYSSDSLSREKQITYYLTDPFYNNKIEHFNVYYLNENVWDGTLIRTLCVALLWEIKKAREDVKIPLENFLNSLGLKPFQELNCEEPVKIEENIRFRRNYIIYNNSDDPIFYNFLNTEGEVLNQSARSLPPKSFRLNEFSLGVNNLIQVLKNDTCNKIYRRVKEDYIIIN